MPGLSVRLTPVGRAEVHLPDDMPPILDVIVEHRVVLTLTARRLDEVTLEELEAAQSLLAALTVFVEHATHWLPPTTDRAIGGAA
ncbi:hypothetical protein Acsp06_19610 [Actinomycetospora sp. NBRC 106375]|uniref:hypothetical protein n=1 Tax=Actinomycetospora sp. NBRC 106375 TaxID=3032207 RepID=UPI0024A54EC5|nr:hypothetical protein [Actinomycetospora sp. NBRC 106375]GLZ45776.1 hypothetical protein Acsp06_19610 [Actinomycetospora sp. NBRC 106375]